MELPIDKPLSIETVIIKVTNDCNMQCSYCFVERSVPRRVFIQYAVLKRLFDELERCAGGDTVHLVWHGGEPTLAGPDFFRRAVALQANRSVRFENLLQTNGALLDDAYLDVLKSLGFSIGLSLDGPAPLHDRARLGRGGASSFQQVQAA